MLRSRKALNVIAVSGIMVLLLLQFVPYGRNHTNPPIKEGPPWNSPETERLARRMCYDCHSNETRWPWYASIAPASWQVQHHVDEGRSELNFSEFNRPQTEASEAAEVVETGEMPPWGYMLAHRESRVSAQEKRTFVEGLRATFVGDGAGQDDTGDHD